MATLYITEFGGSNVAPFSSPAAVSALLPLPPVAEQTVAIGAESAQSGALNNATVCVRLMADVVCSIAIGEDPEATATTLRLAAGVAEYFRVPAWTVQKIAVITNT